MTTNVKWLALYIYLKHIISPYKRLECTNMNKTVLSRNAPTTASFPMISMKENVCIKSYYFGIKPK